MKKWLVTALLFFIVCAVLYPLEIIEKVDVKVTLVFEQIRTPLLTNVFLFLSDVGSIKLILPFCILFSMVLLLKCKFIDILFLFIMFFSVRKINYQLKEFFVRDRPSFDAVYDASHYSFPSGHSMNSIAIYSFICYLLISYFIKNNQQKTLLLITTISLIILIGMSRIYLGVHYLTDVLAGFSAGIAWFIVIAIILEKTKLQFDKNRA